VRKESWAWDALVERYKRLVYSIALRAGLGQEDASDVFQTVFVALFEHAHTLRAPQGLAAWLITTTKRESWRVLRQRQREPTDVDCDVETETTADEGPSLMHADEGVWADQVLVQEALQQMGGGCRDLLRLLYFDSGEPSYEEISRRLKMPQGSIGPTRARCLQKMRELLQGMGMMAG
jgi:RNA polymerase sigma factor (sigma-70 family)